MNGAETLIDMLVSQGVRVCFSNPGTSEMHIVAAIQNDQRLRNVLCLFEGVCTGAADGFARMCETPAMTLLHLGPGLANGTANLHNARRSGAPIVNVVGDHATYHSRYDSPLTSNIESIARSVSAWVRSSNRSDEVAGDARDAFVATLRARPAKSGNVATLVVPADCAWGTAHTLQPVAAPNRYNSVDIENIAEFASRIDSTSALLLDGNALSEAGIRLAGKISHYCGCRILCPTFPARVDSVKAVPLERMPYLPEQVLDVLSSIRRLVLVGASEPVSFFAYEGLPSQLAHENCELIRLSHRHEDCVQALTLLSNALGVATDLDLDVAKSPARPDLPRGPITLSSLGQVLASLVPDGSILSTDSGGGAAAFSALQGVVSHTWLSLTGGAIGQGGPVALGASIACPDRTTFALLGDGGAMYTIQYLWSAAREKSKVVTIILNNRSYNILDFEYGRISIETDDHRAGDVFALQNPDLDWISQARALGVPGARVETCEALAEAISKALDAQGPYLIDALL